MLGGWHLGLNGKMPLDIYGEWTSNGWLQSVCGFPSRSFLIGKSLHWHDHSIQPPLTKSENKLNSRGLNPLLATSITSSEPHVLSTQPAFTFGFSHLGKSLNDPPMPRNQKPPVSLVAWSWRHAPNARCLLLLIRWAEFDSFKLF